MISKDTLKVELAFQAHITEYNSLRNEINIHQASQNQLINYSVLILGGSATLLAVGKPSLASEQPFLLLLASILMSALSWAFIESQLMMNDIGKYIEHVLTPKIQEIISKNDIPEYQVFKWEASRTTQKSRLVLRGLTQTGKFVIPFISGFTFIVLFYYLQPINVWGLLEKILFWIATIMVLIVPISGLLNAFYILEVGYKPYQIPIKKIKKKQREKSVKVFSN